MEKEEEEDEEEKEEEKRKRKNRKQLGKYICSCVRTEWRNWFLVLRYYNYLHRAVVLNIVLVTNCWNYCVFA